MWLAFWGQHRSASISILCTISKKRSGLCYLCNCVSVDHDLADHCCATPHFVFFINKLGCKSITQSTIDDDKWLKAKNPDSNAGVSFYFNLNLISEEHSTEYLLQTYCCGWLHPRLRKIQVLCVSHADRN